MTDNEIRAANFARALAAFNYARDTLNASPEDVTPEHEDMLSDAYHCAFDRAMTTPASSTSDLRAKFEILWEDANSIPRTEHLAAMMADLVRLTSAEPSRTFNPDTWLRNFERFGGGWIERAGEVVLVTPTDPKSRDAIQDLMFQLEGCNARETVNATIRGRAERRAA